MLVSAPSPPVDRRKILQFLTKAYEAASAVPALLNRDRSKDWVEALARQFKDFYAGSNALVLSKGNAENRSIFGVNELLWDISVFRTAEIKAPVQPRTVTYITEALWAIESEFLKNSRATVFDFSKLVLSSATNKLLIAPFFGPRQGSQDHLSEQNKVYLDTFGRVAERCNGLIYIAQIAHPRYWDEIQVSPKLYVWESSSWTDILD